MPKQYTRGPYRTRPIAERFWQKVNQSGECWLWTGKRNKLGYGLMSRSQRPYTTLLAHRVAWEVHFGAIPNELRVCHRCDNPPCVRPTHLFLGTQPENIADMKTKGRARGPNWRHGELNPVAIITESDVRQIRARYAAGDVLQKDLAREFGITQANVSVIVRRLSWSHVV